MESTFTKVEAKKYIGQNVLTNGGLVKITGMFCEGKNSYRLMTDKGVLVSKSAKDDVYIV